MTWGATLAGAHSAVLIVMPWTRDHFAHHVVLLVLGYNVANFCSCCTPISIPPLETALTSSVSVGLADHLSDETKCIVCR